MILPKLSDTCPIHHSLWYQDLGNPVAPRPQQDINFKMTSNEVLLLCVALAPVIALIDALITLYVHVRNVKRHNDHSEAIDRGFNAVIASTSVRAQPIYDADVTPSTPPTRPITPDSPPPVPQKSKLVRQNPKRLIRQSEFPNLDTVFDDDCQCCGS